MNFNVDCQQSEDPCLTKVVPLLVLVKEWGELGDDAFKEIDIVLLLLQGVQQADADKAMLDSELQQKLEEISPPFAARCKESLQFVLGERSRFMDLFDDLSKFLLSPDENSPAILDGSCKHSVLGVFVRRCVLEYKQLTFSQLVRIHDRLQYSDKQSMITDRPVKNDDSHHSVSHCLKELDFSQALEGLRLCHGLSNAEGENSTPKNADLGDLELGRKALYLTELHGKFGHKEEGIFALQEAVRLAQQHKSSLHLEQALAWLHKLHPYSGEDVLVILNKYVKNSIDLNMPQHSVWGRLQQAKTKLELTHEPKSVVAMVMASEAEFGCHDDSEYFKGDLRGQSSILSFMAATWDYYGGKLQGLLNSQLLCHLMSCHCATSLTGDEEEALALSLSMVARYLAETGNFNDGEAVLNSAKKVISSSKSSQILSLCLEELLFDRSLLTGVFDKAQLHLNNIIVLDHLSALHRSALLWKAKGNLHKAMDIAKDCLQRLDGSSSESKVQYKARCLMLLCELYSDLGLPAMALPHIMNCLTLCDNRHLPSQRAKLCLAHLQLQVGSPTDCIQTLKKCVLQTQCEGLLCERGTACLLMAQAKLLATKEKKSTLTTNDIQSVYPMLSDAIHFYQSISDKIMIRKALILQIYLLNHVGLNDERNKLVSELNCILPEL